MDFSSDNRSTWTTFPLTTAQHFTGKHLEHPPLFVRPQFDSSGYTIYLTDLTHIWSESLDTDSLIARAEELRCSIDPSDDENRAALLQILRTSLLNASTSDLTASTDARINLATSTSAPDALTLHISASLPAPLPRLKWECRLHCSSASALSEQLVLPVMLHAHVLQQQINSLLSALRAKDHVVERLCDRLEASGDSLTAVFPGKANVKMKKGERQRIVLGKYVEGLADFDETKWREEFEQRAPVTEKRSEQKKKRDDLNEEAIEDVMKALGVTTGVSEKRAENDVSEHWWRQLPQGEALEDEDIGHGTNMEEVSARSNDDDVAGRRPNARPGRTTEIDPPALSRDMSMQDDEDDGFQRQSTPPGHRKHQIPAGSTHRDDDDEDGESTEDDDEDDDDLDKPSSQIIPSSQAQYVLQASQRLPSVARDARQSFSEASHRPARKLGAFGGRKTSLEQKQRSPTPEPEVLSSSPPRPPTMNVQQTSAEAASRPKLGTFGGRPKRQLPAVELEQTPSNDLASIPSPPAKTRHKLGTFGGKKHDIRETQNARVDSRSNNDDTSGSAAAESATIASKSHMRTSPSASHRHSASRTSDNEQLQAEVNDADPTPPPPPTLKQETSQERADRKREALKHELEDRARANTSVAGGKKKKRRF